ncbi:MAG: family 10 glycosylhydrolase [Bacteroidales bacterium]
MKILLKYYFLVISIVFLTGKKVDAQYFINGEMRAVWIATVNNIDWPTKPGLSVEEQKKELNSLLDVVESFNMNAVVFQVRPAADAFYKSKFEPWSYWLTGVQGKAPDPFWDPLGYMISESHKRGIDVHAWLNPYRAVTDTTNKIDSSHISMIHPGWFLTYGKTVYFDPGLPQVRDYVSSVVADLVRNYAVDAVHMDDYFYPYRIGKLQFPDDSSYSKYPMGFSKEQRDDWRRENVNLIIKQISDSIKKVKSWVEFGISPFGVWRNADKDPAGSATKAGQTNYDDLFADIVLWQKKGWIDYVTPQIYWQIGKEVADYAVLADWWSRNAHGCRLYIGQAPYRVSKTSKEKEWKSSREIIRQIRLNNSIPNISGSMFFSAKVLRNNPDKLRERLLKGPYKDLKTTPPNNKVSFLQPVAPSGLSLTASGNEIIFKWDTAPENKYYILCQYQERRPASKNQAFRIIRITASNKVTLDLDRKNDPGRFGYFLISRSFSNTDSEPVPFQKPNK